jgi:hypothetical protein
MPFVVSFESILPTQQHGPKICSWKAVGPISYIVNVLRNDLPYRATMSISFNSGHLGALKSLGSSGFSGMGAKSEAVFFSNFSTARARIMKSMGLL